jgi:hypothetical protein
LGDWASWGMYRIIGTDGKDYGPISAEQVRQCLGEGRVSGATRVCGADNNDQFPTAAKWCDSISTNVNQSAFQCPLDPGARCAYAFNPALSGKKTDEVNFHTMMFFESNAGWNGTRSREAMATGRHSSRGGEAVVVGYADGSVEIVPASRLDALRWNP